MARIRNDSWKVNQELRDDLEEYVKRDYRRNEILNSVQRRYPNYAWSMRTLATRLKHFEISYINYDANVDAVHAAVSTECEGPGSKLGYRSMCQKIREVHGLQVA